MKKLILSVLFCLVTFYSFGYQIDENFTGQIVKKYKNGQVKSIENFKNGDMENVKAFYENGNLKFEQNLKDRKGKYRGLSKWTVRSRRRSFSRRGNRTLEIL